MESRKLGNKTKLIKLMSNVGNYGLIILTTQRPRKYYKHHKIEQEAHYSL